ncbi:MAG TPA: hypothetical protein DEP84_20115 [Chloroflexi bacterium]|nr:hypothetical protein [Chloroflexota bacterium]
MVVAEKDAQLAGRTGRKWGRRWSRRCSRGRCRACRRRRLGGHGGGRLGGYGRTSGGRSMLVGNQRHVLALARRWCGGRCRRDGCWIRWDHPSLAATGLQDQRRGATQDRRQEATSPPHLGGARRPRRRRGL